MRLTGIHCTVDQMGRVVVPAQVRDMLDIRPNQSLEFRQDKDEIVMLQVSESCIFCGAEEDLIMHREREVCRPCVVNMANL